MQCTGKLKLRYTGDEILYYSVAESQCIRWMKRRMGTSMEAWKFWHLRLKRVTYYFFRHRYARRRECWWWWCARIWSPIFSTYWSRFSNSSIWRVWNQTTRASTRSASISSLCWRSSLPPFVFLSIVLARPKYVTMLSVSSSTTTAVRQSRYVLIVSSRYSSK